MPNHRQMIVDTPASTGGLGKSDKHVAQTAFSNSPIHNGELTDATVKEQFIALVQENVIEDEGHTFGTYDPDYGAAPNLEEVETGGGGLPGSPYGPNIAAPTDGLNPTSIPEAGVEATENARGAGDPFPGDGLRSPSASAQTISSQTIRVGSIKYGTSTPGGGS